MGKKEQICPKCGKLFKLGRQDRFLRKRVTSLMNKAPMIKQAGIGDHAKNLTEWCNECWRDELKPMLQNLAVGM